jgi:WD40 repeat protein
MNSKILPTEFSDIDKQSPVRRFSEDASSGMQREESLRYNRDQVAVKAPRLTFKGHENAVLSVALLEIPGTNELLVVSGSEDKSVAVWSMKTGALLSRVRGHTQRVVAIATYMSDSVEPVAITGSWDEYIRIWPLKYCMQGASKCETAMTSECMVLKGHTNRITSLRATTLQSGDAVIISGSTDASIRVWSIVKGQFLYSIFNANMVTWVLSLAVFFDTEHGDVVVSGGKDSLMRMWALRDPQSEDAAEPIKTISGSPSRVVSIVSYTTNTDTLLVTLCRDFIIRVWSVKRGELVRKMVGHSNSVTDLTLCHWALHNTAVVVSSSSNGNLRVWLLSTGELLRVFNGHSEETSTVVCYPTKSETNDIIIVSGSVDKTLRSWLFAEETSLTLLQHGVTAEGHKIRINSMDVYSVGDDVVVVTASEDGCARGFALNYRDHSQRLLWCKKISKQRLCAVSVYTPVHNATYPQLDGKSVVIPLDAPLAVFAGRDQKVRFLNLFTGDQVGPILEGHTGVVTCLYVYSGCRPQYLPGKTSREAILPFLMTGSEDNTMKLWSIAEGRCLFTCVGHAFDVTAVCAYVAEPYKHRGRQSHGDTAILAQGQSARLSADGSLTNRSVLSRAHIDELGPPVLLTGSLDNTVRLWSHSTGELIAELRDSPASVTSLATLDLPFGPVVAGGGGNGAVRIWSLQEPYLLLHTLVGHTDEVQAVQMYNAEGLYPVLVSASWDMTLKVWSLNTFNVIRTIEGHTAEISSIAVFTPGGTDPAVASSSTDTTVRVAFDFLGSVPKVDFIRQSFQFDLDSVNSHVVAAAAADPDEEDGEENRWPRTTKLVDDMGATSFFTHYFFLFHEAVEHHRSDFVAKFLPLSTVALVKTNNLKKFPNGSLLNLAISVNEVLSVNVIVTCWIRFLTATPSEEHDLFYNQWARISMEDMILLAEQFPKEFERIVCAIDLQPISAAVTVEPGTHYLSTASDGSVFLSSVGAQAEHDLFLQKDRHRKICFYSLPLVNMAHMDMLKAMVEASQALDSVSMFDSDAGQMALGFAWRKFGRKTHIVAMVLYFLYVVIAATSIYSFKYIQHDPVYWPVSLVLILLQLALDAYFIYVEFFQLILAPVEYVSDIWNQIDLVIIVGGLVGNIVRLVEWDETNASRILLSITSVFMWFNTLFYLRAFEATGPLVSMIVRIATDMRALMFVVLVVLVGFSQAFWLISNESNNSPFANIDDSLVVSFVFMLGGYDTSGFEDLPQPMKSYGLFLSAVYMMIVSILLLNLLIALMGDSFGE